jgi:hypothetical protein
MRIFFLFVLMVGILSLGYFVVSIVFSDSETPGASTDAGLTGDSLVGGNSTITPIPDPEQDSETMQLQTESGYGVTANNFRKVSEVKNIGSGMYHLGAKADYQIVYNSANDSFAINIAAKPVLETRDRAIAELTEMLNISTFELCLLNIYISTTAAFDPNYAGKNIGINGC